MFVDTARHLARATSASFKIIAALPLASMKLGVQTQPRKLFPRSTAGLIKMGGDCDPEFSGCF